MTPAGTSSRRDSEGSQREATIERASAAHSAVHEHVLIFLQLRPVVFYILRTIFNIGRDNIHITPAEVGVVDVVGPEVSKHVPPPGQSLVRLVAVGNHAEVPGAELFERRIQLAVNVGLFVVKVALHRIDGGRRIGRGLRVCLRDWHGMFQSDGNRQPLQNIRRGFLARLLNVRINFHGLAVPSWAEASAPHFFGIGAVCHQHLLHEIGVRQQLLDQRPFLFALLSKLRQTARGCFVQNDKFHELSV